MYALFSWQRCLLPEKRTIFIDLRNSFITFEPDSQAMKFLVFRGVNKPTNDECRETLKQFGAGGYRNCGSICAKLH